MGLKTQDFWPRINCSQMKLPDYFFGEFFYFYSDQLGPYCALLILIILAIGGVMALLPNFEHKSQIDLCRPRVPLFSSIGQRTKKSVVSHCRVPLFSAVTKLTSRPKWLHTYQSNRFFQAVRTWSQWFSRLAMPHSGYAQFLVDICSIGTVLGDCCK